MSCWPTGSASPSRGWPPGWSTRSCCTSRPRWYLRPTLQADGRDTILRLRERRQVGELSAEQERTFAADERDTEISLEQVRLL
jgi:hypothetical protein